MYKKFVFCSARCVLVHCITDKLILSLRSNASKACSYCTVILQLPFVLFNCLIFSLAPSRLSFIILYTTDMSHLLHTTKHMRSMSSSAVLITRVRHVSYVKPSKLKAAAKECARVTRVRSSVKACQKSVEVYFEAAGNLCAHRRSLNKG